jgi:nitrate/nitrite transporter NarK
MFLHPLTSEDWQSSIEAPAHTGPTLQRSDLFSGDPLGKATGFIGVAGGLSGLHFPLLTRYLVDRFSYAPVFTMVAFMPLIGTTYSLLWQGDIAR